MEEVGYKFTVDENEVECQQKEVNVKKSDNKPEWSCEIE